MAGHSKWAQIKRKKGVADARRGLLFSKIARMIILAARGGDTNPESNVRLALAINRARAIDMPKDGIERAIAKASGKDALAVEEFLYEAYGPGGGALLIEGITDSTNRTTQEIKHILVEHGGKLANPGTVAWMFKKWSELVLDRGKNVLSVDELELVAIDAGAESTDRDDDCITARFDQSEARRAEAFFRTRDIHVRDISSSYIPTQPISVPSTSLQPLTKLIEALEEHPDVSSVYTNIDPLYARS